MKPEGIRKVLVEQGPEGAIAYLAERIEQLEKALMHALQPIADSSQTVTDEGEQHG